MTARWRSRAAAAPAACCPGPAVPADGARCSGHPGSPKDQPGKFREKSKPAPPVDNQRSTNQVNLTDRGISGPCGTQGASGTSGRSAGTGRRSKSGRSGNNDDSASPNNRRCGNGVCDHFKEDIQVKKISQNEASETSGGSAETGNG